MIRTPFPKIDIIGAMVIVWRVRGNISGLFCAILCTTIVHSAVHTHVNGPNSSLDWVLSHWAHFIVLRFIFTRRRSFAEYWKYFVARFNDFHTFGYNSARSERIWTKFGELRVYCLELALTDFGRDPRRSESGRPCGSFVFFVR